MSTQLEVDRIEQGPVWTDTFSHAKPYYAAFARAIAQVLPCALLALTLVGSGLTRRDVFVAKGDMRAPCPMPFGSRRVSWMSLGVITAILLAGGLIVQLTLTLGPDARMVSRALAALPRHRIRGGERRAGGVPVPRRVAS